MCRTNDSLIVGTDGDLSTTPAATLHPRVILPVSLKTDDRDTRRKAAQGTSASGFTHSMIGALCSENCEMMVFRARTHRTHHQLTINSISMFRLRGPNAVRRNLFSPPPAMNKHVTSGFSGRGGASKVAYQAVQALMRMVCSFKY